METQICISKTAFNIGKIGECGKTTKVDNVADLGDLILTVFYDHPRLTITFNGIDNERYVYDGSLEAILKSNNVDFIVNAEYFISGVKNTNYMNIDENVLIFSFPLQVNYVSSIIKVVCERVCTGQNYVIEKAINKSSEKLLAKIVDLDNKYNELKLKVESLSKCTHVDFTVLFNVPLRFNDNTTSIHLQIQSKEYTHKLVFPPSLLYLRIYCAYCDTSIILPPKLKGLNLSNLGIYNHPIDIPDTMEEIILDGLSEFNHPLIVPQSTKKLHVGRLPKFSSLLTIPETMEDLDIRDIGYPGNKFEIKCFSQKDYIVKMVLNIPNCGNVYLPKILQKSLNCASGGPPKNTYGTLEFF